MMLVVVTVLVDGDDGDHNIMYMLAGSLFSHKNPNKILNHSVSSSLHH